MFGLKNESDINFILDKIKILNEKLLEKLTTNPNSIIENKKSEHEDKIELGFKKQCKQIGRIYTHRLRKKKFST